LHIKYVGEEREQGGDEEDRKHEGDKIRRRKSEGEEGGMRTLSPTTTRISSSQ